MRAPVSLSTKIVWSKILSCSVVALLKFSEETEYSMDSLSICTGH